MISFARAAFVSSVIAGVGCSPAATPASSPAPLAAMPAAPAAMAGAAPSEAPPGDAHAPLVHRFERAEDWAKVFDEPGRDTWQKPEVVVRVLDARPGMTIADLGAGTGYFEPYLSRAVGPRGHVLALDVEPDMVRYLGERAAREKLANVTPRLVKVDSPELSPGSVDRVLVVDTWHHIADREGYARKLADALAPGGVVAIVDFTGEARRGPPQAHRLAPEQVARELAAGGLATTIASESLPDQYVVLGAKR
jgi:SAM-dependent methyltransferase